MGRENSFGEYSTIDIENDTIAIFDNGFEGYIDEPNGVMKFGGECLVLNFRYQFFRERLLLNQEEYDEENDISFVGKKCDYTCCDKQKEYFKNIVLDINLPSTVGTEKVLPYTSINPSLACPIYLGKLKKRFNDIFTDDYLVCLGDNSLGIEKFEPWRKKILIKIPENKRRLSSILVYADSETPTALLKVTLEKVFRAGIPYLYLATKENGDEFSIGFLKITPDHADEYIDFYFN